MESGLKILLTAFIGLVIGVTLLISTADNTQRSTQLNAVNNQTTALINGTAVSLGYNQLNSLTSIYNATNASQTVAAANYTVDLPQGTVTLLNGRTGNYNVTFTYYLVGDSTARTLLTTNNLFFALGILLLLIAVAYPLFKDMMNLG